MRTIIIIIVLLNVCLYSQSWNNIITTQINEPNIVRMNMFTNRYGNHIVMQLDGGNNSIKYYLINSQGSIIRSVILESSANGEFPDIDGNNDIIFVTYRLGSKIIVKYTNNNGQDWNSFQSPHNFSTNLCNSLDIEYYEQGNSENNGLHIVWSLRDSYPYYKTYYYQFDLNNNFFRHCEVTNYPGEVGGFATVAVDYDKVLVSYNWGTQQDPLGNSAIEKTRIRYSLNWLNPQNVTFNNESSARSNVKFFNNLMYCFYFEPWSDLGQWGYHLIMKSKSDIYANWSGHIVFDQYTTNPRLLTLLEITYSNKLNIMYYENTGTRNLVHQYYDGQNWSSKTNVYSSQYYAPQVFSFSSSSNDLYLIWKDDSSNYLKYCQYDAAPLAPTNLTVTAFNGRPKLVWTINSEPDVRINNYAYKIERRLDVQGSGQWSNWQQIGTSDGQTGEFVDNSIISAGSGPSYAQYRLKAQDIGGNYSDYSSSSTINYGNGMEKMVYKNYDFKLIGNYPNPFNPETKITFSIPQSGKVYLKVYNVIGEMIAELTMNELEAGEHHLLFNSEQYNLKSGIYFYELRFNENKSIGKMVLIK